MTFKARLAKDVAASATEAIDWLVHSLLPLGILALLAAYPKVGKSTLATQLAVAVAQGQPFLGCPTRQGGVLYVVAEERRDDVIRRLHDFGWTDPDPIWLWEEQVVDSLDDRKTMSGFIAQNKIALVIIDTWASYLMVQDETNNSQVTIKMQPYVDMAHESGATILFIHHERKGRDEGGDDSRAIRGGGAILGLADLSFQLQRDGAPREANSRSLGGIPRFPEN